MTRSRLDRLQLWVVVDHEDVTYAHVDMYYTFTTHERAFKHMKWLQKKRPGHTFRLAQVALEPTGREWFENVKLKKQMEAREEIAKVFEEEPAVEEIDWSVSYDVE